MYVPYSMDDSEPDLYGSLGGHYERDHELDKAVEVFRRDTYSYTQEDMTKVIQHNLREVARYRSEIEELLGLVSFIYNRCEHLPPGVSQQLREQITMDRH